MVIASHDSDAAGIVNRKGKNRLENERVKFIEEDKYSPQYEQFKLDTMKNDEHCEPIPIMEKERVPVIPELEPDTTECCPKPDKYRYKVIKVIMDFGDCTSELSFVMDKEMVLTSVETVNVYDFKLIVNGELMNLENEIKFYDGDEITVRISSDDVEKPSELTLVGYDPNVAFDNEQLAESSLDEPIDEEHILINHEEEETNGN